MNYVGNLIFTRMGSNWLFSLWILMLTWQGECQSSHREVTAVIGNTAILPCSVDYIGTQQVIWKDPRSDIITINEQRITDDTRFSVLRPYVREWNLKIEQVRRTDQGTYTCIINTTPVKSKLISLEVRYPPTITESSPGVIAAKLGDDIMLRCNATGYPAPRITWFKFTSTGDRQELARDRTTYSLANVTQAQGGTYECLADNDVSPADRKTFKIDIRFPPEVRLPYEKISQQLGKDTLLECIITANPLTTHFWEKDGHRLEDDGKYRIHIWDVSEYTKSMGAFVTNLVETDYGTYKCVAENEFGTVEDTMSLYEWQSGDIRVISTPSDVISHRGQTVNFDCTVDGLSHRDSLTWWKYSPSSGFQKLFVSHPSATGTPVYLDSDKYEIKGHYNLYIHDVTHTDSGMYVCEISGHRNYSANFTVVESPHCDSNRTLEEGMSAMLVCSLSYSGSSVDFRTDWIHGDRKLSSVNEDEAGHMRRYVMFAASLADSGVYQCLVSSRTPSFTDTCTTTLTVKPFSGTAQPVCQDVSGMMDVTMVIGLFGAGAGGLLILFICILTAVVINFRRQLRKYKREAKKASPEHQKLSGYGMDKDNRRYHSPRSVRYKNGNLSMETDALTTRDLVDQAEVEV